ncbi:MAG TPA: copper homeostasis protein CutC [Longimicrobiaceae bacterium]
MREDGAARPPAVLVEACVDSVESALAAQAGGAGRVELCDDLVEGGTTPSAGMIELCCERVGIPVFVMIRPRGGDFLYSDAEFEVMRRDVGRAAALGAAGIVLGLLRADGSVDVERTRRLVEEARPLPVTFHRAIDVSRDTDEALDALLALGVDRVLTSGRAASAEAGLDVIARMVQRAAGRIVVLAGGGVKEENVGRIVAGAGVREVHVRGTVVRPSAMTYRNPAVDFGGRTAVPDSLLEVTDRARLERLVRLADEAARPPD